MNCFCGRCHPIHLLLWAIGLLLSMPARAQTPGWQQALAIATTAGSTSTVTASAADASGSVYVAGNFGGTISLGGTTLNSGAGTYDAFVAKWNPAAAQWQWAVAIPSGQTVSINSLVVEGTKLYVGGVFLSSVIFGSTTLTSPASYRGFVAKLLDTGSSATFGWAQGIGGATYDYVLQLAVQGASLYIVGALNSPTVSFGSFTITNPGYSTGYVARLVDAGPTASYAWVRAIASPRLSRLSAVVVAGTSVYVAGYFAGLATLDANTLASSNANDVDVVVAKLTDAGSSATFAWASQAGGTGTDRVGALAVAGTSLYVAGDADSPSAAFGSTRLSHLGQTDIFVARLTDTGPVGRFDWAQQAGGTGFEGVQALAVRGRYVYACGFTTSAQAHFGATTLAGLGDYDAFVARLLDAGSSASFEWARQAGGATSDQANALTLVGPTQVVVSGYLNGAAQFGALTLTSPTHETFGFLASLDDATALATTARLAGGEMGIFPNPAHGRATVQLPALPAPATFTLLDALGHPLRTQTASANARTELDLTSLAPGLYAVRVQAGSQTATQRLVVE